jgi:hypothetical protein
MDKNKCVTRPIINLTNISNIRSTIEQECWHEVLQNDDADIAYDKFSNVF